jgi:hypothetical protein
MTRILILFAFTATVAFAQKGEKLPFPEIVPKGFAHPDALGDRAHFRKEFENQRTRVLRVHLAADDTSGLYEAPDGLFVCFRECHVRLVDPDGHDQDIHLQDGESRWVWAGMRKLRNLSTHSVEMLFVEFKPAAQS